MKPTILVATDFSDNAAPAAHWAEQFARDSDYRVVAVHVTEINFANWASGAYDQLEDSALLRKAEARIEEWYEEAVGRRPDVVDARVGTAKVQIAEAAEEYGADYLVVARSGKNALQKFWLGSTAQALANEPPCRTFIVHPDHAEMNLGQMAVGTDFSANSENAVETAAELAAELGCRLNVVHASEEPVLDDLDEDVPEELKVEDLYGQATERMERLLADHEASLEKIDFDSHVIEAQPAHGLIEFVQENAIPLVVVGRTGHSQFAAPILGSVLSKIIHYVDATVLITPNVGEEES